MGAETASDPHQSPGRKTLQQETQAISTRRPEAPQRGGNFGPRVNHRIRVPEVRLVGAEGEMMGVLSTSDAQKLAREAGLDLVEVNPKAHPPVCKIMDFGKFKYEEKKRQGEARKRQTSIELKEIKIRPKTDDHDLDFKIKHVRRFIEEGNKVKITCRFRGREITHPEPAQRQLEFIAESVNDVASVETPPRMEGRTMSLILSPGAGRGRAIGMRGPQPVVVEQRARPVAPPAAAPLAAPPPAKPE